ncbi:P2-related tail formation protein [Roseimarinus sediminis]
MLKFKSLGKVIESSRSFRKRQVIKLLYFIIQKGGSPVFVQAAVDPFSYYERLNDFFLLLPFFVWENH